MKKVSLIMVVTMTLAFVAASAQHPEYMNPTGGITQTGGYPLGYACDSVINADSIEVDQAALGELRRQMPLLDSLSLQIEKAKISLMESDAAQGSIARELQESHEQIDSMLEEGTRNANSIFMTNLLVNIGGLLKVYRNESASRHASMNHLAELQDAYNAVAYPAKLLYRKALKGLAIEESNACQNAFVYRHGKKVVSLAHYMR